VQNNGFKLQFKCQFAFENIFKLTKNCPVTRAKTNEPSAGLHNVCLEPHG